MSTLREHGTAYLAMRRSLGYKLDGHGRLLMKFIGYLEDHGRSTIATETALAWATAPADATQAYQNQRLSMARCFARYLSAFDPACQIPPTGLTGPPQARPAPYLYSPEDISALIHAAGTLAGPLQSATFQSLVSVLAVTGIRPGEAVALDVGDVDLDAAMVTVHGKYDRTQLVPMHAVTVAMLRRYRERCRHLCPASSSPAFFLSAAGTRLTGSRVDAVFAQLMALAGITGRAGRPQRADERPLREPQPHRQARGPPRLRLPQPRQPATPRPHRLHPRNQEKNSVTTSNHATNSNRTKRIPG